FALLAEQAEQGLLGAEQAQWLDALDLDLDNLRATLRWAGERGTQGVPSSAVRIGAALWKYWEVRGLLGEGWAHLSHLLDGLDGQPEDAGSARLRRAAAHVAFLRGDYEAAGELQTRYLAWAEAAHDDRAAAIAMNGLGLVAMCLGDHPAA